jgi:hypothetical protein
MRKSARCSRSRAGEPPEPKRQPEQARAVEPALYAPFGGSEAQAVAAMLEEVFGPVGRQWEKPAGREVVAPEEQPPREAA